MSKFSTAHPTFEQLEDRNMMDATPASSALALPDALTSLQVRGEQMQVANDRVDHLQATISGWKTELLGDTQVANGANAELVTTQTALQNAVARHEELTATIQTLNGTVALLTTEQGEIEEKNPQLQVQIDTLHEQLVQWKAAYEELLVSLKAAETQMESLRQQNAKEESDVADRTKAVDIQTAVVSQADTNVKQSDGKLQTAFSSLSQSQTALQTAQNTLVADQKKLSEAQATLATATKNYNDIYKRYGKITIGKYPQMVKDAKTAMNKAKATVDALTLTVKKDRDAVNTAIATIDMWTKARGAGAKTAAANKNALATAKVGLDTAVASLTEAIAARTKTGKDITDLQPQLYALRTAVADHALTIVGLESAVADKSSMLQHNTARLTEILQKLEALRVQLGELRSQNTEVVATIDALKGHITTTRSAFDAVFAEIAEDQLMIASTETDMLFAKEQVTQTAKDLETMQKIVSDLIQLILITQKEAPAASPVRIAPVLSSLMMVHPLIEVTKNGDWLDIHTKYFNGAQTLPFGSITITPQEGDHMLTIPGAYAPDEIRDNIPAIQDRLNRQVAQMPWRNVAAPASNAGDLFMPSVLGTWKAETVASNGQLTPVSLSEPAHNVGGVTGLTGITPDGSEGRELVGATPILSTRQISNDEIRIQIDNMPEGYTLRIDRWFREGGRKAVFVEPITPGSYFANISTAQEQNGFYYTIISNNTIVRYGKFTTGQMILPLAMTEIPSALPAGTRDRPLSILANESDTPISLPMTGGSTRSLESGSVLVHPTAGKDVRLSFTPTSAGRVMPHGTIVDLDTRGGDGVTVTLARRRADGTIATPWTTTLGKGGTLQIGSMPVGFFAMEGGDSIELTISSGNNDICDSVEVNMQLAIECPSFPTAMALPMGTIAGELQGRLGSELIDRAQVFDRGPGVPTYDSSTEDIARWITGGAYDSMGPNDRAAHRSAVDIAKNGMWQAYVNTMSTAFTDVLMEKNGVLKERRSGIITDPTRHNYHASIPNAPRWEDFYAAAERAFTVCYGTYKNICGASGTLMDDQKIEQKRLDALDEGVHQALIAKGLVNAHMSSLEDRPLALQKQLDAIFIEAYGTPDRSGWTLADFNHLATQVAGAGTEERQATTHDPIKPATKEQTDEALAFLSTQDRNIRTGLSIFMDDNEINSILQQLKNNPQPLIDTNTQAFKPVQLASSDPNAFGPDRNPQRLASTLDWARTSTAKSLLSSVSGEGSLATNTGVAVNILKYSLPQFKGMTTTEKKAMTNRAVSWLGGFEMLGVTAQAGLINPTIGMGALYLQSISPVVRALNAKSVEDSFKILQKEGLIEYSPGDGKHAGKLVVINSGHLQDIGEVNVNQDGAQKAYNEFRDKGYEVLHFQVGVAYDPLMRNTSDFLTLAKNILNARLQGAENFWKAVTVNEIEMMGYSWGGGQASVLVKDLRNQNINIPINLALVDAVADGYFDFLAGPSVTERPDVNSVFNRYQLQGNANITSFILEAAVKGMWAASTITNMPILTRSSMDAFFSHLASISSEGNPAHGIAFPMQPGDDQHEVIWLDGSKPSNQRTPVNHIKIDDDITLDPDPSNTKNISVTEAAIAFLMSKAQ
ncbi:hypothetical protein EXS70_04115 [Candidatus Peribacteria bacterium]|nr:hypothetical protein [Candidatus Peribacteria bacterium]